MAAPCLVCTCPTINPNPGGTKGSCRNNTQRITLPHNVALASCSNNTLCTASPDRLYFIGRRKQCHLPGQGAINPSVSYVDLVLGWIGGLWPDWEKQWAVLFLEARVCSAARPGRCCRLTAPPAHPQLSYFRAPRQQQHTSISTY